MFDNNNISINDVVKEINKIENSHIESKLSSIGYPKGKSSRNLKFRILEVRRYKVDKNFPILSLDDISNEAIKTHLKHLSYTIDLTSLHFENWDVATEELSV